MTEFRTVTLPEQPAATLREQVPMADLRGFFDRAFSTVMSALQAQGRQPAGPPFAHYYGDPGETVDVEAGFPVSSPIEPAAGAGVGSLPGGRAVEAVHVGPYEDLPLTYEALQAWSQEQGLTLAEDMWETYLSDPSTQPDPSTWRTEIFWRVASGETRP